MRLRDQIILEARELIRADLADTGVTPERVIGDVAQLVEQMETTEDAMGLATMFAGIERIREAVFARGRAAAEASEQETAPTEPADEVGLTD